MNDSTLLKPTTNLRASVPWWQKILGPKVAPYLFIAPFFILFLFFWVFPVGWSVLLSFQKWSAVDTTFVGLQNFKFVISSPAVKKAFSNIAWYAVFNNLFQIPIALFIAILIDLPFLRRWSGFYRGSFFLPNLVSGVSTAILFSIILGTNGVFNQVFGNSILWFQSTVWSKPAVLLAGGWRWIGYWVVMFMAGLQGIPDEYYEAGYLDGANAWQRFRYITFPLLRPVFLFVLVVNTMGTLQIFEEPFLLLNGGGPVNSSTTPVVEMYKLGFQSFDLGGAAALGWLLAIVIVGISIAQLMLARRRGWYE